MTQEITFLEPGPRNPDGSDGDPVPFAISWASVKSLFAQQIKEGQNVVKQVTHLVVIPYLEGLNEAMQVQVESRVWQIVGIEDPDERHVELRVLCVERDQNA